MQSVDRNDERHEYMARPIRHNGMLCNLDSLLRITSFVSRPPALIDARFGACIPFVGYVKIDSE
jgi:hypothetical protein